MSMTDLIMAASAVVTALSAFGAFTYTRRAARDARWSRRALEGEEHSDGLIETVATNLKRSRRNARALRREGLRTDGGRDE
ncbi:hypothetical protein [Halobacterium noricense]|uniref:hypothetical protein n=1 Tax=Halobacterium noricense TaxID=223182 RepID=UPI001E3A9F12|nr:hypothetical protein [Halobacterium noricense]UHH26461.1 hypothetical protein LT974_05865 [Halobacterium noricense]